MGEGIKPGGDRFPSARSPAPAPSPGGDGENGRALGFLYKERYSLLASPSLFWKEIELSQQRASAGADIRSIC